MKKLVCTLAVAVMLFASCESKPTLQKYFVEKSESKDFAAIDIAPSFIKTDKLKLSAEEKAALESLHHLNLLVYSAKDSNTTAYDKELNNVKNLIKDDSYDELIKFNRDGMGASISTKGEGEHIEEFIILANNKGAGFGVARVTGDDMTPANVMTIVNLLQKADLNMEQFKPIQNMLKK
ncbi:DUF4252 domain-containing protein [Flavobacterium sp. Sd200]|uniref:DUF4252 domain-containing protein n=1 Tax=Flavobacterium sp. Sd200 TaxID=2692211 RepID=UPI00136FD302|nr:DUF4252 domain-containing protein [Flavobacterium sp. Sd200]MXN90275.1 DUF4252 domain-containing protein [Flavobacterium sp. Sd200]